jgi:hypothetical protein
MDGLFKTVALRIEFETLDKSIVQRMDQMAKLLGSMEPFKQEMTNKIAQVEKAALATLEEKYESL